MTFSSVGVSGGSIWKKKMALALFLGLSGCGVGSAVGGAVGSVAGGTVDLILRSDTASFEAEDWR